MKAYTIAAIVFLLTGCAQVKIKKASTDPNQEGIPFYLPRPYVQVYEPFVIGSEIALVSGKLSSDGQYILIDDINDPKLLNDLMKYGPVKDGVAQIPTADVKEPGTTPEFNGGPQADAVNEQDPASPPASSTGAGKGEADTGANEGDKKDETSIGKDAEPVGNFNLSVTNTSAIFAPTLGRRFFDIIWLPDFDEKYVVEASPGLGNSNISATMTQGWGLYGLDAKLDNSALVKPLLEFYSTGLDSLSKLAKSKILPASALEGGAPQSALGVVNGKTATRVTVKISKVRVAAPGLYPILKPNEKVVSGIDSGTIDDKKILVPKRPYTNIAFNTYDVVVIEAAKAAGDTPLNFQRYFDSENSPPAPNNAVTSPGKNNAVVNPAEITKSVNAKLALADAGSKHWVLTDSKYDGKKFKANISLAGTGGEPKTTIPEVKGAIADSSSGALSIPNIELIKK